MLIFQTFISSQQVESICWEEDGESFHSSHNDGSVTHWKINETSDENENTKTIYGPFPCKAIPKLICQQSAQDLKYINLLLYNILLISFIHIRLILFFISEKLLIFSGGMPRACYGDRHAVTVRLGTTKHVAFELTSKIIDFFTTTSSVKEKGNILLLYDEYGLIIIIK